jgi:arylsulfatase A-like enzyme
MKKQSPLSAVARPALFCLLLMVPALLPAAEDPVRVPRPNIVFIVADDLGWADTGCYGSTFYETPNIDRLAGQGMRFTDAYAASSVCSPTRASILTGKYPARLHLTDWLPGRPDRPDQKLNRPPFRQLLSPRESTVAKALKEAGYRTAFIGKWHLGGSPGCWPEHLGFDLNIAGSGRGQPPSYFSPYGLPNLKDGPAGEYLNDRLTEEALRFIDSAKNQPFFLYLPHYAVHLPLQAKTEVIRKYEAKAATLPKTGAETIMERDQAVRQLQNHPVYAGMVQSLDESVGRILERLTKLGLDKNTIVIFTSDNGGLSTTGGATSNLPLRGGKGWPYEGGIREPLLVKWPGVTKPGSLSSVPVTSTDFFPTLLQLAGLPLHPKEHLDGTSFLTALKGDGLPERPLFWHYPHYSNQGGAPNGAVRLGDYKLIEWYEDMSTELFNLRNDPGERHDLAVSMPGKVTELRSLLQRWRKEVRAQMPSRNPHYDPAARRSGHQPPVAPVNSVDA